MITTDDSLFPVLVQKWRAPISDGEMRAFFASQRQYAQRAIREGVYLCSLTGEGDGLDSKQRKLVAELTDQIPAEERARTILSAVVVTSSFTRGVITAIKWALKERIEPVATAEEAVLAARKEYDRRGLRPPAGLLDGRALARLNEDMAHYRASGA